MARSLEPSNVLNHLVNYIAINDENTKILGNLGRIPVYNSL